MKTNWISFLAVFLLFALIIWAIIFQIKEKHLQDDPKLQEIRNILHPMFNQNIKYNHILEGLNNENILHKVSFYKGNKSYTINKHKIFLCLQDENGNYYNNNLLIYVTLHEIAHAICDEIGHTEKFHSIFEALLEKATELGIYNPSIPIDPDYCSHTKE